jgi:hypothetical protein
MWSRTTIAVAYPSIDTNGPTPTGRGDSNLVAVAIPNDHIAIHNRPQAHPGLNENTGTQRNPGAIGQFDTDPQVDP